MNKNDFIGLRSSIISRLICCIIDGNKDFEKELKKACAAFDDIFDELTAPYMEIWERGSSWEQIDRDKLNKENL